MNWVQTAPQKHRAKPFQFHGREYFRAAVNRMGAELCGLVATWCAYTDPEFPALGRAIATFHRTLYGAKMAAARRIEAHRR